MSALSTLKGLNNGRVMDDLERSLHEVLQGVISTNGKGEVTLRLKVEFEEEDGARCAVAINGEVKNKVPRAGRPKQTHYVTGLEEDGAHLGLTRRDPSQPPLKGTEDETGAERRTVEVLEKRQANGA